MGTETNPTALSSSFNTGLNGVVPSVDALSKPIEGVTEGSAVGVPMPTRQAVGALGNVGVDPGKVPHLGRPAGNETSTSAKDLAGAKPATFPIKGKVWVEGLSSDAGFRAGVNGKFDFQMSKDTKLSVTASQIYRDPNAAGKPSNARSTLTLGVSHVLFKDKATEFGVNASLYGQHTVPFNRGLAATELGATGGLSLKHALTKELKLEIAPTLKGSWTFSGGDVKPAVTFNGDATLRYTFPHSDVSLFGTAAVEYNMTEPNLAVAGVLGVNAPIGKDGWYVEGALAHSFLGNGSSNPGFPFSRDDGGTSFVVRVGKSFEIK
jgi:hypothetical protein